MQTLLKEKVNVYAVFRGFSDQDGPRPTGWQHKRIEPLCVKRREGEVLKVKKVRQSYAQRKSDRLQVHFAIHCRGDRYFHLVFDADKIAWILLYEFTDAMQINDQELDIEIKVTRK